MAENKDPSRNISLVLDEYFNPDNKEERKLKENREKRAKIIKDDAGL